MVWAFAEHVSPSDGSHDKCSTMTRYVVTTDSRQLESTGWRGECFVDRAVPRTCSILRLREERTHEARISNKSLSNIRLPLSNIAIGSEVRHDG